MSLSPMRWFFPLADSDRRAKRRAGKRRRHDVRRTERLEARLLLTGPTVATQAATSILATAATLHGSVNAQGQTADVTFQYSTSPYFTPTVQTTFATGFNFPGGVAVDAAGDVFVADSNNNVVKKILPDGSVQTIGSGFNIPAGVAVDAAGDVFVADSGNNAVKKILPNGDIQTLGPGFHIPAGVAVDATGDVFVAEFLMNIAVKEIPAGGGAIQTLGSGFNAPYGVAVDGAGNVFVADFIKNAVEKILPNGDIKTLGSGFSGPHGVAVDAAGDVFVADSGNDAVKEILPDGRVQTLGSGFSDPLGVAVDAAGNLFVADGHNNRIVKLSPTSLAAAPSQVSGSTTTAVAANLTGLTPGTTYFYRTVASSSGVGMAADAIRAGIRSRIACCRDTGTAASVVRSKHWRN